MTTGEPTVVVGAETLSDDILSPLRLSAPVLLPFRSLLLYISRMDGNAAESSTAHVWRMSTARQAQFLIIALIAAGIAVVIGGGAILYSEDIVIGVIVIIAAGVGAAWAALQLRSSLTLTGNTLIVRTATKTHEIPFQQLAHVSAGRYGIYLRMSDGRKITSLVAENSDWSQSFGLKTKASGIVDAINNAIGTDHPAAAAPVLAVPEHESAVAELGPAVTGEVAPSPGRKPAGRLVKTIRVSALMTVLGAACFLGGCAAIGAQSDSAAALLAHGTRAPGTVTDVSGYHMDVRFVRDSKPATVRINLNDSSDVYRTGDRVTVIYDPAHPDRARTIREDGQSQGSVWIMVLLLVAGAFLLIGGIANLVRARRQLPTGVHVLSLLRTHRPALCEPAIVGAPPRCRRLTAPWACSA